MLTIVLMLSVLAACGGNNKTNNTQSNTSTGNNSANQTDSNEGETGDVELEPYELTLAVPVFGTVPADVEKVQAEINKITQAEINTTVTILPISIGNFAQQMNLMMSSGEKLDLAYAFGANGYYNTQVVTGKALEIDELLKEYGQGIIDQVGVEFIDAAKVNGKLYGVPINGSFSQVPAIFMRKDLVEKYNIDTAAIQSLEDLTDVFAVIKDNEPNLAPLASGLTSPLEFYRPYDRLGDNYGVLPGFDNGLQVVNLYETDEYVNALNVVRGWYQAGYLNKDASTSQTPPNEYLKADRAFSYMGVDKPGIGIETEERSVGKELVKVDLLSDAYATTNDVLVGLWTVAHQSKNPERAMMMLNLMYTNSDLVNLLVWGIENEHYVKVSDNQVKYPEGKDASTVDYGIPAWLMGNQFISYVYETDNPEMYDNMRESNKTAKKSAAMGFSFNSESLKNELTALSNVISQYKKVLETGSVDPTTKLAEFNEKLKNAGLEKVIAEKQKQLDEWAVSNK